MITRLLAAAAAFFLLFLFSPAQQAEGQTSGSGYDCHTLNITGTSDPHISSVFMAPGDENWDSRFGYPGIQGVIYVMKVHGDDIYIGGSFQYADNVEANNIVRFNTRTSTFSAMGTGVDDHVHSIEVADNGDVYIGGEFWRAGDDTARGVARWDGSQWHRLGSGISGGTGHFGSCVWAIKAVGDDIYFGGDFDTINGRQINGLARWNRTTNQLSALGDGTSGIIYALGTMGNDLYVAGDIDRAGILVVGNIARWDGSDWSILGKGVSNGVNSTIFAMESENGLLYVGGAFTTANGDSIQRIATWDGTTWAPLGGGLSGGIGNRETVFDIEVRSGEVYAGGAFYDQGNLARWNGSVWEKIGQGTVFALGLVDTMLFAGGEFKYNDCKRFGRWNIPSKTWTCFERGIGSDLAAAIAVHGDDVYIGTRSVINVWNSSKDTWSRLGGIAYTINDLVVDGDYLYVGGDLDTVNGVANTWLARWSFTTQQWESLISGQTNFDDLKVLALKDSLLYVGGIFFEINGESYRGIAAMNTKTSSWSALGEGLYDVRAIAFLGNDVIAGGLFEEYGANTLTNIARWDGKDWLPLGNGLPNGVEALAVSGNTLYAGGYFDTLGFSIVHHIARWENNSWTGMEGGVYDTTQAPSSVRALAVDGDDLYVAGDFTKAGLLDASNIARWNNTTRIWSTLGSGISGSVYELTLVDNSLYAGGFFTYAGGKISLNLARWSVSSNSSVIPSAQSGNDQMVSVVNSANGSATVISYTLASHDRITLELFDQLGRRVALLQRGMMEAGTHRIEFDMRNLVRGSYFIRLVTSKSCATQIFVIQ